MSRPARPKQYFATAHRVPHASHKIDWQALPLPAGPVLAQRLVQRGSWTHDVAQRHGANDSEFLATTQFSTLWDETVPAALDELPMPRPRRDAPTARPARDGADAVPFQHSFDFDKPSSR